MNPSLIIWEIANALPSSHPQYISFWVIYLAVAFWSPIVTFIGSLILFRSTSSIIGCIVALKYTFWIFGFVNLDKINETSSKNPRSKRVSASSAMKVVTDENSKSIFSKTCFNHKGVEIKICVFTQNYSTSSYDLGIKALRRNFTFNYLGFGLKTRNYL